MAENFVVNDVVTMEWEKSLWIQTKAAKGKKAAFLCACKKYDNDEGETIPVFFVATTAFIMEDDGGIYTFQDVKSLVQEEYGTQFPEMYEDYVSLCNAPEFECNMENLERYGLSAHAEDIQKRLRDVAPYGIEHDASSDM